jgi:hypothetical protein
VFDGTWTNYTAPESSLSAQTRAGSALRMFGSVIPGQTPSVMLLSHSEAVLKGPSPESRDGWITLRFPDAQLRI